jgi:pentatricopeptide repeat protein
VNVAHLNPGLLKTVGHLDYADRLRGARGFCFRLSWGRDCDGFCAGEFRSAMQVFGEMTAEKCQPNVKTFTSLINACRRGGHVEEAQSVFEAMKEYSVQPNVMTYNALINVYTERGEQGRAQSVFLEMVQAGLQPTGVSFTVLMSSFKATGAFKDVSIPLQSFKK